MIYNNKETSNVLVFLLLKLYFKLERYEMIIRDNKLENDLNEIRRNVRISVICWKIVIVSFLFIIGLNISRLLV